MDGYDVVGDVHGHADALEALLADMGYRERGGAWRHDGRVALFVGDFVDRGPAQRRTVDVVRRMLDAGSAHAVMGNHEFNAIAFATSDDEGGHLRDRNEKNASQHRRFLEEFPVDGDDHRDAIAWMRTLPLWLDLPEVRIVHACWHEASMEALGPYMRDDGTLRDEGHRDAATKGTKAYTAAEVVMKGMEAPLPTGVTFFDKDGHERSVTRTRWWDTDALTIRSAALLDDETRHALPDNPLDASYLVQDDDVRPLFFGHYWMSGAPMLLSDKATCLDFSVAAGGRLCAYRFDGEETLKSERIVSVPADVMPRATNRAYRP